MLQINSSYTAYTINVNDGAQLAGSGTINATATASSGDNVLTYASSTASSFGGTLSGGALSRTAGSR